MALSTLFAVLKADAADRAEALRLALLRRRWALEWAVEKARLWDEVERSLTPAHWRDIREWRTEP